jgi:hypothetical protein
MHITQLEIEQYTYVITRENLIGSNWRQAISRKYATFYRQRMNRPNARHVEVLQLVGNHRPAAVF